MEKKQIIKMTPCQQNVHRLVSRQLDWGIPFMTLIQAEPGSGLSTLMENLKSSFGSTCLFITTRPAISGLNLIEAIYYELGLAGENIDHRAPVPAYLAPLVKLLPITTICVEDLDDFTVTAPMRKTTIGHLSKLATALPDVNFVLSQSSSRSETDCIVGHRDIVGCHERNECYLQSFTDLDHYIDHFKIVIESLGQPGLSDCALEELYAKTKGNLALTVLHLCHPFLRMRWSNNQMLHNG